MNWVKKLIKGVFSGIANWFLRDLHRVWWVAILILPLVAFFVDKTLLSQILALLIAYPLVGFFFRIFDIFSGGRGQKTILSGGLYTKKINAFPAFISEIILIATLGAMLEGVLIVYLNNVLSVMLVYVIMILLFVYYLTFGSKEA